MVQRAAVVAEVQETTEAVFPDPAFLEAFERERMAFREMWSQLLPRYQGRYVAIRGGKVIASGKDKKKLAMRVRKKYGRVPVYFQKVDPNEVVPSAYISSPQVEEKVQLPTVYQKDVHRAVEILKEAGCTHVFLFGSLAVGKVREESDIDLAVRGCPKGRFFRLLGQLLLELDHSVDLVNLDRQDAFARYLETEGELLQIG